MDAEKWFTFQANINIWAKGVVKAKNKDEALDKIKQGEYDTLLDTEPQEVKDVWDLVEGYDEE